MAQQLFEYALVFHPHQTKAQKDEGVEAKSVILKPPTVVLARDAQEVAMLAAREIPEAYTDKLNQVQIAVRTF